MGKSSGFAQIHRALKAVARDAERSANARSREHQAAVRRAEQARKSEERASRQATRSIEADRKRLEKEEAAAHVASMQIEVDERNAALEEVYREIDGLLAATLDVDDFVDLESFRVVADHPPFSSVNENSAPLPHRLVSPPPPQLSAPPEPTGIGRLFGRKKHAEALADAEAAHAEAVRTWQARVATLPARQAELDRLYALAEEQRIQRLAAEREAYAAECAAREADVAARNTKLDQLIANLGYGTPEAVEEYISIVLANAVYPDSFPVEADFSFEPQTAELSLKATVVAPDKLPNIKAYKYTKATDEITPVLLSQKAQKDRYNGAVHQAALRLLHEVFEADRRGLVRTISVEIGTRTIDPATGITTYIPFVAVAAQREKFIAFDLSAVVPVATLDHLGASVSKNPHGLVAADTRGIMKS